MLNCGKEKIVGGQVTVGVEKHRVGLDYVSHKVKGGYQGK